MNYIWRSTLTITSDWHIHTRNSNDCQHFGIGGSIKDLIRHASEKGIADLGFSDHVNIRSHLADLAASRKEFDEANPSPHVHFGVEISCMSQWELEQLATGDHGKPRAGIRSGGPPGAPVALPITAEDIERYHVDYVLGATHWPMYVPLERHAIIHDYHRQNMFLATHPLVDIVGHPWWWASGWQNPDGTITTKPWLDDFTVIPQSMHDEFAAAVIEQDKAIELNLDGLLLCNVYPDGFKRQYLDFMAGIKEKGVQLSIGSDCHSADYDVDFETASKMLDSVGIRDEDLWCLPPRPTIPDGK